MSARGPHNSNITWTPYVRVAWGGICGGEGEIWTNSMKYVPLDNSAITTNQVQAAEPGVWAALKGWVDNSNGSNSYISNQSTLQWLKINQINGTGLQENGDTNYYAPTPVVGGSIGTMLPLYQTFALSLRSGLKRGRGHIGRIFPPTVSGGSLDSNGRCSTTTATTMADSFGKCIEAMQLALRTDFTVGGFAICSAGNALKNTVPVSHVIVSVECDTVPDVQHRRTNRLLRATGTSRAIAG